MKYQLRKTDTVYISNRYQLADDVAAKLALNLHGMSSWQGVQNNGIYSTPGLRNLANRFLRSLPNDGANGAIVIEVELDDTTSHYYPSWVVVNRGSLYDTSAPVVRDLSIEACCLRS